MKPFNIFFILLAFSLGTVVSPAQSVENADRSIIIELNRLQPNESACRASFVIQNKTGTALGNLDLELVLFDEEQRIIKTVSLGAGALPEEKSRVSQIDLPELGCDALGQLMLNTITKCEGEALTPDICLSISKTRSRADIELIY